jgi:DNA-binding GntR family transcriptional regulator
MGVKTSAPHGLPEVCFCSKSRDQSRERRHLDTPPRGIQPPLGLGYAVSMLDPADAKTGDDGESLPAVQAVHAQLRQDILRGKLPPGSLLVQLQLAAEYGVSRTPLREALRMLQEEGLVHAENNRRARVAEFRLDDLEAISAQRILASALATSLTVGHLDAAAVTRMEALLADMRAASQADQADAWRRANVAFHDTHYAQAPPLLLQDMRRLTERNNLYRAIWTRDEPHLDAQSESEHRTILDACRARDVTGATRAIARHNARIAITVMAIAIPEREPVTIRTALQLALGTHTDGK